MKVSLYVLIHIKILPWEFRILRIVELYTRKFCVMFVYKHTETIEYVKNFKANF